MAGATAPTPTKIAQVLVVALCVVVALQPVPPDAVAVASKGLRHHIKTMIGVSIAVDILPPGGVERSGGKAKRIRDLRPK